MGHTSVNMSVQTLDPYLCPLVCPHILFQACATNFFYTSNVIKMKPDKLWYDEFTVMYEYSNEPKKELPGKLN